MKTVIVTHVQKVTVRIKNTYTLVCTKYFFDLDRAIKFMDEIKENNQNLEITQQCLFCEDTITYTEE